MNILEYMTMFDKNLIKFSRRIERYETIKIFDKTRYLVDEIDLQISQNEVGHIKK